MAIYMDKSLAVIGGFGDFESPSECWGVKLLGVFDDRESAHGFAEIQYQGYRDEFWGVGESFKSYFVLVVDGGELAQWGLVK